jgi:hypothetical protein
MGLLSARAIKQALGAGELVIDPPPEEEHFDSDSIDVHLGDSIYKWRALEGGAAITIPLWKGPRSSTRSSRRRTSWLFPRTPTAS